MIRPINASRREALLMILAAIAVLGCESQDRRIAEFAERAAQQQVQQNERIAQQSETVARQNQELASAAHQLVDQDAAARREMIEAHGQLQQQIFQERSGVDRQREQLNIERKSVLAATIREPVIAQAIVAGALILAALLPLLVTAYAIRRLPEQSAADELLAETLEGFVVSPAASLGSELQRPFLPAESESAGPSEPPTGDVPTA
jgi:hypothetical protein